MVKAFRLEKILEVSNMVNLDNIKDHFSRQTKDQNGEIAKPPQGKGHLLADQEIMTFHPVAYEAQGNLLGCCSMFRDGWLMTCTNASLEPEKKSLECKVVTMRLTRISMRKDCSIVTFPVAAGKGTRKSL